MSVTGKEKSARDERIGKFVEALKSEPLVQKYLRKETWISGSSTTVFPIGIWLDSVELQWESDRKIFGKFIERIVEANKDLLDWGSFQKTDGSCPSSIVFKLRKEWCAV